MVGHIERSANGESVVCNMVLPGNKYGCKNLYLLKKIYLLDEITCFLSVSIRAHGVFP